MKILSLVSSVFDPLGLFAPFSVHMKRLLKSIWTKNEQHWDNSVEPNEEELQAAVMSVRIKEQIVKEHESKIQSCNFWTDSTTVLQWIHSSHRKQQVFVANRVAEILDN